MVDVFKSYFSRFIIITCVVLLSACSNLDSVSQAPVDAGISREFQGDHEFVKAAVLASMQSLNIHIKDTRQSEQGYIILFTKGITAMSWGEVGRVVVVDEGGDKNVVRVHSSGRVKAQLFGVKEEQFAVSIFNDVSNILSRNPK